MNTTNNLSAILATENMKTQREAQQQLAQEVLNLLTHREDEGLQWTGTNIDLMEALHLAYETGSLQDDEGICLTFTTIVCRACTLLHVSQPSNPYECASRGCRRKGRRMQSFLCRYVRGMQRPGRDSALWQKIDTTK